MINLTRAFMWYDHLYNWLSSLNYLLLSVIGLAFTAQFIFILFFFVKKVVFPKASKQNKFAILIPARNEASVIGETIKGLLKTIDYPRDLFDIYVVADNCTDNTAEVAKKAGAIVFKRFDDEPSHKRASYAMKFGYLEIMKLNKGYDAYIKFDADNLCSANYLEKMNDALEAKVEIARGFEASTNFDQNMWTRISALYYLRDSRIVCRVRERAHLDCMLTGAGMMVSHNVLVKVDGWDAMGTSDDAEFTIKRILDGYRVHFVEEAVVYEDQPSSFEDTFNRNKRMGHGLHLLFYKYGFKMILKFFLTFRVSYIDLFLQLFFIPIAILCCTWLPLYYIYDVIWSLTMKIGVAPDYGYLMTLLYIVLGALIFLFYLSFVIQTVLVMLTNKEYVHFKKKSAALGTILFYPFFMIIYCLAIFFGAVTKPKWKAVKRNVLPPTNS